MEFLKLREISSTASKNLMYKIKTYVHLGVEGNSMMKCR